MKILITLSIGILLFTGCATRTQTTQLKHINAQQKLRIQQQQMQIDTLRKALSQKGTRKSLARRKKKIKNNLNSIPVAPKKIIKLKKVEDTNYTSRYMYPGASKKKPSKVVPKVVTTTSTSSATTSSGMEKAECIAMIGADKFAKYTQMFGSEAASLKRCKMLKAMKQ